MKADEWLRTDEAENFRRFEVAKVELEKRIRQLEKENSDLREEKAAMCDLGVIAKDDLIAKIKALQQENEQLKRDLVAALPTTE